MGCITASVIMDRGTRRHGYPTEIFNPLQGCWSVLMDPASRPHGLLLGADHRHGPLHPVLMGCSSPVRLHGHAARFHGL